MPPSVKLNLPTSSGGSTGSGCPTSFDRVPTNADRDSAAAGRAGQARVRTELAQRTLEGQPPTADLQGQVGAGRTAPQGRRRGRRRAASRSPWRCRPTNRARRERADRGGEVGLLGDHREAALASLKISVPLSMVSRPSDSGRAGPGLGAGLASATDGVNSQFGLPAALTSGRSWARPESPRRPRCRHSGGQNGRLHRDRLDLDHIGVLRARRVEEFHALDRDNRARQQ